MLSLEQVSSGYGNSACIEGINLAFEKGSLLSIIGKNGCGKSTLLKTACGLIKPLQGNVLLEGKDQGDFKAKAWARRVSLLSQRQTIPSISIETLVMHGRFPYQGFSRKPTSQDHEIVEKAIDRMGLETYRSKSLLDVSGGERQKAYLAMLLAQDTDYIFLDEPSTYLDIQYQGEMLSLLEELQAEGKCVVAVMHDLGSALQHSTSICLMDKGKILCVASPCKLEQSGLLQETFSIKTEKIKGEHGTAYLFF